MAKTDFPLSIDRRRLLVCAAALPAVSIVPGAQRAEHLANVVQPSAPPPAVPALNVTAATARRLLEISRLAGVRAFRGGSSQGNLGRDAKAPPRSGRNSKLATELDRGNVPPEPSPHNPTAAVSGYTQD